MDVLALTSVLPELPIKRTRLLDNLGRIRREVGPLTPQLADALADHMNIRRGEVHEVVSFYSFLREPIDVVRVCTGPVCDCLGARAGAGELAVACVGHCDLAPVRMEGDTVVGGVTHRANGFLLEADELGEPPELGQDEVVARLEASGLTGMGGAGFPTWRKWDAVRHEPGPRVVIVNADEGEPGTIKDRYVMELRPQLLLEGLAAAMRFCETEEAYIYLREEYATSRALLREAIAARGLPVEIVVGAGSYVCGEETAMLKSMEGRRGIPRLRPPFPAQYGYLGRPTLINNVETLANVALVLRGEWSPARLWSVSGAVREPGCYEAPLDVTTRQLIDDYAGGATEEIGSGVPGGGASGVPPPAGPRPVESAGSMAQIRPYLVIAELVISGLLMAGVLLQTPKATGLGGTIGGGGADFGGGYRTRRGLERQLYWTTWVLVFGFLAVSLANILVATHTK